MQVVPAGRKSDAVAETQAEVRFLQAMRHGMGVQAHTVPDGLERAVMDEAQVPRRGTE